MADEGRAWEIFCAGRKRPTMVAGCWSGGRKGPEVCDITAATLEGWRANIPWHSNSTWRHEEPNVSPSEGW